MNHPSGCSGEKTGPSRCSWWLDAIDLVPVVSGLLWRQWHVLLEHGWHAATQCAIGTGLILRVAPRHRWRAGWSSGGRCRRSVLLLTLTTNVDGHRGTRLRLPSAPSRRTELLQIRRQRWWRWALQSTARRRTKAHLLGELLLRLLLLIARE